MSLASELDCLYSLLKAGSTAGPRSAKSSISKHASSPGRAGSEVLATVYRECKFLYREHR